MKSLDLYNYQDQYRDMVKHIRRMHDEHVDGITVARRLTEETDIFIRNLFELLDPSLKDPVAILALGGYGRCELSPQSDIDVLILYRDGANKKTAEHSSMAFLHLLYDAGFNVGHSFRSFEEMLDLHNTDYDSWASLLESRFLTGSATLYNEFVHTLHTLHNSNKNLAFIRHVIEQIKQRHQRYGNSVKLLEPNVKYSAGGLRDLHSFIWINRYLKSNPLPYVTEDNHRYISACESLIREYAELTKIDPVQKDRLLEALRYLLRVRHQLHFLSGNTHDTLDFSIQESVARNLGYTDKGSRRAVESFMRDYYLHAREIATFNELFVQTFSELYHPPRLVRDHTILLDEIYTFDGNQVGLTDEFPAKWQMTGLHLLRPFLHQAKKGASISSRLRRFIYDHLSLADENLAQSREAGGIFASILRAPYAAAALRSMHTCGVLERFIPEFGDLVAFFQHNLYHFYTADEHTLIAIDKLNELQDKDNLLGELYRTLPYREELYLATLFHDIGKPRRINDHEIIGADMTEAILTRLGRNENLDDILFLIRHHLLMEQVAFRRNIYEQTTINEFASRFSHKHQLDMLYLLTYADLSAVNPKIWTDWKNQLLQELYLRSSDIFMRQSDDDDGIERYRTSVNKLIKKISSFMPEDSIRSHIDQFDDRSYIASFSDKEISQHIESIERSRRAGAAATMHYTHHRGFTELTIIMEDRPFALSDLCGILTANDCNIIDANIFTRSDGILIDKFRVTDYATEKALGNETCATILKQLELLTANRLDNLENLIEQHRRKWKRRQRSHSKTENSFDVRFDETPHHTIIDVYGPDMIGMLYRLTRTISEIGLSIDFAKIATRVDGIVDSFYILTREGKKVHPDAYPEIKEKILNSVTPLLV
jgi:[protein-PII] uridylyltransferase